MKKYADLGDFTEDKRIETICRVLNAGRTTAVLVDDWKGKAEHYIKKILAGAPNSRLIEQFDGPTKGVITLMFGPKENLE